MTLLVSCLLPAYLPAESNLGTEQLTAVEEDLCHKNVNNDNSALGNQ